MNTAHLNETKPTFLDHLQAFLTRFRTVLLIILISVAVAAVALFVILEVRSSQTETALARVEELQESYGEWLTLPETDQSEEYEALSAEIQAILGDYQRGYARQRTLFIQAQVLEKLERWDESREVYLEVAASSAESYLAPISITLAAVASENAGQPEQALEILTDLIDAYDSDVSEIPRALFSVGRINESLGNIADAAASYRRLIDEHPGSSWTNLARARIITLTVQGRIGS